MGGLRYFLRRVRALIRGEKVLDEIEAELQFHIDMRAEENLRRGLPADEARRQAERQFGHLGRLKEQGYEVRGGGWLEALWQDLRYGARMLRKNPGFTVVVVLSLAIGIGANTAVFSLINALLLRPLPYPNPDRLAILWLRSPGTNIDQDWPSPAQYLEIKSGNQVFEEVAIAIGENSNLTGLEQPEKVEVIQASSNLFSMLGAKAILGRTFLPEEDTPGKPKTAVLSYTIWKRLFGGDPQILGRSLTLDGDPYTVVGVLDPKFVLNHEVMPTVGGIDKAEFLLPLALGADAANDRGDENYNIMARLKPGVSMREAQADIDVLADHIRDAEKKDPSFVISVVPLFEQVVGDVRRAVFVLFGAVALVLLIACANVANLLLARASAREKEVAIRTALGAGRIRLVRQLMTESVLLGLLGGVVGLLIAAGSLYLVRTINPGNIPRLNEVGIDGGVLAFTFGVSILTGILFGVAPALRVSHVNLNITLKAGGRTGQTGGGFGFRRDTLRSLLVVAELVLSLMLLIGAGLLIRSFVRLQNVPPGFNADNLITMRLALDGSRYKERPSRSKFYEDLLERLSRLPGVKGQGAVTTLPLSPSVGWGGIQVEGYTPPGNEPQLQADQRIATSEYFQTMEIPLLKGRFFSTTDTSDSQPIVLVDQKLAERFWPNEDPTGKRLRPGSNGPWRTVIGVVGIVKQYGLDTDGRMVIYYPHKQIPASDMYLVARTTSDPAALSSAITGEVYALDPDVPVYDSSTMQARLQNSLARRRFAMTMLGAFAGFALILATIGVYAVLSYLVTQGTRDMGVRIALGAQPHNILRLVVQQGLGLTIVGIAGGLLGAVSLTRLMASLLFGVSATDLLTFVAIGALLMLVALVACYIPARRASKVDPMVALRYE